MCPSARNGTHTSCAVWRSGLPTCSFFSAITSALRAHSSFGEQDHARTIYPIAHRREKRRRHASATERLRGSGSTLLIFFSPGVLVAGPFPHDEALLAQRTKPGEVPEKGKETTPHPSSTFDPVYTADVALWTGDSQPFRTFGRCRTSDCACEVGLRHRDLQGKKAIN